MPKSIVRKKPCRICRRWFMPNPRLKERQMTCGNSLCKKEWHRKKCGRVGTGVESRSPRRTARTVFQYTALLTASQHGKACTGKPGAPIDRSSPVA